MNVNAISPEQQLYLLLEHGHAGLQKAAELRRMQAKEAADMRALIPSTIDALIDSEFISKEARAEATKKLEDPVTCLKFLKKMAEVAMPRRNATNYDFGSPVKQPEQQQSSSPWRFGNSAEVRAKADAAWWGE